jgi:NADPH:quinone reductase-like Zn-dependent oxidoreductase
MSTQNHTTPDTMRAIVFTEYGGPEVLRLQTLPRPTPKPNQLLVRLRASSVNYGDLSCRNFGNLTTREFNMPAVLFIIARVSFGLNKPKTPVLGAEFSGEVAAVGAAVTRFKVGEAVFGYLGAVFGGYAEYVCINEDGRVAHKPSALTHEQAATVPYGALTALNLLRSAPPQAGQHILINGASGAIGGAAVQLAKLSGAHVTGVCSTPRVEYVRALGADQVIDYTQSDFTQHGQRYDLILDVLGRGSFERGKAVLTPNGRYLYASFKIKQVWQMLATSQHSNQKVICALSGETQNDLVQIKDYLEAGSFKALVDRCYPLAQTAAAHAYAESGQRQGGIAITIA